MAMSFNNLHMRRDWCKVEKLRTLEKIENLQQYLRVYYFKIFTVFGFCRCSFMIKNKRQQSFLKKKKKKVC